MKASAGYLVDVNHHHFSAAGVSITLHRIPSMLRTNYVWEARDTLRSKGAWNISWRGVDPRVQRYASLAQNLSDEARLMLRRDIECWRRSGYRGDRSMLSRVLWQVTDRPVECIIISTRLSGCNLKPSRTSKPLTPAKILILFVQKVDSIDI